VTSYLACSGNWRRRPIGLNHIATHPRTAMTPPIQKVSTMPTVEKTYLEPPGVEREHSESWQRQLADRATQRADAPAEPELAQSQR
jgi:hypothetical protein